MSKPRRPPKSPTIVTATPGKARKGALPHAKPHSAPAPDAGAVLDALLEQEKGASLDFALSRALKNVPRLDQQARRRVVQALYHINRRRARLTWHLGRAKVRVTPHNLFLAYTAFERQAEPKGVRISALDRALLEHLARETFDDEKMPEAIRLEVPEAFESALRATLGDRFADEMKASLEPAPVDLRVNTLKATIREARFKLKQEHVESRPTPFSPWGLRAANGTNASATEAFASGAIEFQDEASQCAVLLVDARAGMQVLDFCAGTGGKTLALGATMENKGHLVATDLSTVRMARAKQRLTRAGVENAERRELPAVDDKWLKKHYGKFDRVLVDAPCSGTGSWRRNPDARWSTQAANLKELTALQDKILARAANFVKPSGRLIYATCSLLQEENDDRVEAFLKTNPNFTQLNARELWQHITDREWPSANEEVLRLSPAKHGTDGFFATVFERAE